MSGLAEEYISAVKANNPETANTLFNEMSDAKPSVKVSKKEVMAAYNSLPEGKGKTKFRRFFINPGTHVTILKGKKGGKTRRGRGSRRTRRA